MIRVRKIAHASYEMPDPGKQTEYYTDILGLNLIAKEKDAVYLANTVDHHSVVLRKGDQAKCTRVGFQIGPQEDLNEFEKQTQKHGVKTARKKDPEPSISDMLVFEDPKGTTIEVFKRPDLLHQKFPTKGVVPHKLGHVAFHCEDVKKVAQFYIDVLGFREFGLDGGFLRVPAMRARPSHDQSDGHRLQPPLPYRLRGAQLGPIAGGLRFPELEWLQDTVGPRPPWHRPQSVCLSPQP